MIKSFREPSPVMLACNKDWTHEDLKGSYCIQNKIDGVRVWGKPGDSGETLLATRKHGKYIQNKFTREKFCIPAYLNLDGEMVIPGKSFHDTSGILRSHNDPRGADAVWMVFDYVDKRGTMSYMQRRNLLMNCAAHLTGVNLVVAPLYCKDAPELHLEYLQAEMDRYQLPFEGYILRQLEGKYKCGRATVKEATLFKLVANETASALCVGMLQRESQDKCAPLEEVGALICDYGGRLIRIGSGFSRAQAEYWWINRATLTHNKSIAFKYKKEGTLHLPRQPIYVSGLP